MKLIHLTDIHLTTPGATIAGRDPNANFERALAHALAAHRDAAAIVITGDLSDWGDPDDYRRLGETIAACAQPVHLAIGNHDDRAAFLSVFPALADPNGFVQHSFALPDGTGVVIDTVEPATHAGSFCEARAAWLDRELGAAEAPVYLFMHHNPMPTGVPATDIIMLAEPERLGAVLARHRGKVRHLFHGHCHLPLAGSFHGVPFSAPRGTNHQGFVDFFARDELVGSDLPEAYAVAFIEPAGVMVTMVEYGYDGRVRSGGSPHKADWDRATMAR